MADLTTEGGNHQQTDKADDQLVKQRQRDRRLR